MSMCLYIKSLPISELKQLTENPDALASMAMPAIGGPANILNMLRRTSNTTNEASAAEPALDLHKSWHLLHYLFTGTAWTGTAPANTLLLGGREVGEDLGYGSARIVDSEATTSFHHYLSSLSLADLENRIDAPAMSKLDIYCAEGGEDSAAELQEDLEHYFPMLKEYVSGAADRGHGMVIWMM